MVVMDSPIFGLTRPPRAELLLLRMLSRASKLRSTRIVGLWRKRRLRFFVVNKPAKALSLAIPGRPKLQPRSWPTGVIRPLTPGLWSGARLQFSYTSWDARFSQIEVPKHARRRGWAEDMVRVLLKVYPETQWYNVALNEISGPLFLKMSEMYPDRIAAVHRHSDGSYDVLPEGVRADWLGLGPELPR